MNKQPFNHCNKTLTTDRAIANEFVKLYSNNQKKSPYSRQKSKDIKQLIRQSKKESTHPTPIFDYDFSDECSPRWLRW